jgi:hypothetical protein
MGEAAPWVAKAREGDHAAVVETDAELALSLHRGACHRLGYVAAPGAIASASRACERSGGGTSSPYQELEREKEIRLSLRTVEREVRHLRQELERGTGDDSL